MVSAILRKLTGSKKGVILEYEKPQEVGQARRRALIRERRPANLTGVHLAPKGVRDWKGLQKQKTDPVLWKRDRNLYFPASKLFTFLLPGPKSQAGSKVS